MALYGDTLAEVLEHYFLNSEQLASRFWLFTGEKRAAGLFLQQLPSPSPSAEDWDRLNYLAATTTGEEILSLPPNEMLHRLFHEESIRVYEPKALRFHCSCSREKIESTLFSMGRSTLQEILDEQGSISVNCEFCNAHYSFDEKQVYSLFTIETENDQQH